MDIARRQLGLAEDSPFTGRGIRIAVLDTGIDVSHPDLSGRINEDLSESFSFRSDLDDRNGHGSHIAGIIGGTGKASNGLYRGVAPNCELVVMKIAEQGSAPEGNAAAAIAAAIDAKVDVINYSHGFVPNVGQAPWLWPESLSVLEDAFLDASEAGILCLIAAGNSGPYESSITRPGGLESVLTVGAIAADAAVLPTSGRGPFRRSGSLRDGGVTRFDRYLHADVRRIRKPDVVAPGELVAPSVSGLLHAGDPDLDDPLYVLVKGTSQATAVVSGLAGLLLEAVRSHSIDLGAQPVRTLRRLFTHASLKLSEASLEEAGSGMPFWPNLLAVLRDFQVDGEYRDQVLHDGLELL